MALRDDMTPMLTGAGANINDPISRADSFFVMLHDYEGIADITQSFQGCDEARIVPLV
jgi:hypothetical protein